MTIRWRKEMSVGNAWIDHDHKYLLCLINTVELALKAGDQEEFLIYTLDQLQDYTVEHFGREERIMRKIQYPKYAAHKSQHQELLKTLETLRGHVEKLLPTVVDAVADEAKAAVKADGDPDPGSAAAAATPREDDGDAIAGLGADIDALLEPGSVDRDAIVDLLRHWILDHVLKTDLEMKPLLSRYPSELV